MLEEIFTTGFKIVLGLITLLAIPAITVGAAFVFALHHPLVAIAIVVVFVSCLVTIAFVFD